MKKLVSSRPFKWLALSSFALMAAFLLSLPSKSIANLPPERLQLPLPDAQSLLTTAELEIEQTELPATPTPPSKVLKVGKNESLSQVLGRADIGASVVYKLANTKNSKLITFIKPGDTLKVWLDNQGGLEKIVYPKSATTSVEVLKTSDGFEITKQVADVEIRTASASGVIQDSFYLAAQEAGLSPKSIMGLADLYAWEIDFIRELKQGDQIRVIYEQRFLDGEYLGDGNIIAAEITTDHQQHKHFAFMMRDGDELVGYFDEKGKNLKKAFLRNPVDVVRITSRFNPNRVHPIFKTIRPHRGVDYGGPIGTPIKATGNGKIIARGYEKRGYGNYIKIQHANNYMTVYGHMSKFGKFKRGQTVKQGDIIGYLGSTGASTGPHLHYEFRIRGRHVDPLKVKFDAAGPVPAKYKAQFMQNSQVLLSQLDRIGQQEQYALNFE